MPIKKIIVSVIFLVLINQMPPLYSQDQGMAKFYIEKAYSFYNNNEFGAAHDTLQKAKEYSLNFPEYYYIDNLVIDKTSKLYDIESINADKILLNLDNSFLVEKYFLIKNTAEVYKNVRSFDKSNNAFKKLLLYRDRITDSDFHEYIQMLFDSGNGALIKQIVPAIEAGRELFDNPDYDYYSLLFDVLYSKLDFRAFLNRYNALNSNYYSREKLLYLKALYYYSARNLNSVFDEYSTLAKNNDISTKYRKKILYNLLAKNRYLARGQIVALLEEWNSIGQNDYLSVYLINDKRLSQIIDNNVGLKKDYLNYSGERYLDEDDDARWEKLFRYKNGVLIENIVDSNQDGVYEYKTDYFDDGKLNGFYLYNKSNSDYSKFVFNHNDQSLDSIEYYSNDNKTGTDYMIKSEYYPSPGELIRPDFDRIKKLIVMKEKFINVHSIEKLSDAKIVYVDYDRDNDNFFEERDFYKDDKLNESFKDLNENGIYEFYEKFNEGKPEYIKYKTDDSYDLYDYMEYFYKDRTEKYWDNDLDGIFETKIIEYKNKNVVYYFDVNFDKIYDYSVEIIDGVKKMYKLGNNKKILLKEYNISSVSEKNRWNIISSRNIDNLSKPDSIMIEDTKSISGIFVYKGIKKIFKNGVIKGEGLNYKIFIINGKMYLFDLSE